MKGEENYVTQDNGILITVILYFTIISLDFNNTMDVETFSKLLFTLPYLVH